MDEMLKRMTSRSSEMDRESKKRGLRSSHKNFIYDNCGVEVEKFLDYRGRLSDYAIRFSKYSDLLESIRNETRVYFDLNVNYTLLKCGMLIKRSSDVPVYQLDRLDYFLLSNNELADLILDRTECYVTVAQEFRTKLKKDRMNKFYITLPDFDSLSFMTESAKLDILGSMNSSGPSSILMSDNKIYFLLRQDYDFEFVKSMASKAAVNSIQSYITFLPFTSVMELLLEFSRD